MAGANGKTGGTTNGHIQPTHHTTISPGRGFTNQDLEDCGENRTAPYAGEYGHDGWAGGNGSAHSGRDEGGSSHGADSGESAGMSDAASGGGEWPFAGGEEPVGSDMHKAFRDGRASIYHRAAIARATFALGSIDTAPLLDMLNPSRVVYRMIEAERVRIAQRRTFAPYSDPLIRDPEAAGRAAKTRLYAPMHQALAVLPLAIERVKTAMAGYEWWRPSSRVEHREAVFALAVSDAAVTAASPSRDKVDDVVFLARARAENAADAYAAWHSVEGQELDHAERLLDCIVAAVDKGNAAMCRAVLDGGVAAALRLQKERQAEVDGAEVKAIGLEQRTEQSSLNLPF